MSTNDIAAIVVIGCFVGLPCIVFLIACFYTLIKFVEDKNKRTKKLSVKQIENLMIKILNSPYLKRTEFNEGYLILEQRYEDTSVIWTFGDNKITCYTKVAFKNEFSVFVKPSSLSKYKNFKKKLCNNIHTATMNAIFNQTIDYLAGNVLDITPELLKFYLTTEIEEDTNIIDNVIGFKIS